MQQEISMVYLSEAQPFSPIFRAFRSPGRSSVTNIGRTGDLIVLEKAGNEVTVITSEENSPCVEELRKALLKGKKISVRVTERGELHRLFTRICNFFGFTQAQ